MLAIYHELLFRPIFNLLIALYNLVGGDIGLAIIALTLIVRALLWPVTKKSLASQKAMQEIQPKLKEIQERLKDDKERQAQEMMELYKKEKVHPFSSCLPLLIQLPLFIALYQALRAGLEHQNLEELYSFVSSPGEVSTIAFGFVDLADKNIVLAVLAAVFQYFQARMMSTQRPPVKGKGSQDEDTMAIMNKQMMYMMPALTLFIGFTLPGGLMLYWMLTTVSMIVQQYLSFSKKDEPEAEVIPAE